MKKFLLSLFTFLLCTTFSFSQGDIMLLPSIAKDKSEVVRAYSRKNGKTVEWYYDNTLKKMQKSGEGFQLPAGIGITANVLMKAYIGADGSEVLLVWNSATAKSESWYYDETEKKMKKSGEGYQLPQNIALGANVLMFPYIGADGSEVILCWETASGKSVSFYFDNTTKKFTKSADNYQLPANPGVGGKVMMHPYIGSDGSEVILVWDAVSGKSVSYYFNNTDKKYAKSGDNYQLPANPGVSGNVMMYPYIGADGSEVILTWSVSTGASNMWYNDNTTKKYEKAKDGYQLPATTGITKNAMMTPFIGNNKDEVIYVWDTSTGASVNFYFDNTAKAYKKSGDGFQLPAKVLE
jgi:hypothetical protein